MKRMTEDLTLQPLLLSLPSRFSLTQASQLLRHVHPTINRWAAGEFDPAARLLTTPAAAVGIAGATATTAFDYVKTFLSAGAIQVKRAGEQHYERQRSQHYSQDRLSHG